MSETPWSVVFAEEAINDLLLITEYLTQAYCGFENHRLRPIVMPRCASR